MDEVVASASGTTVCPVPEPEIVDPFPAADKVVPVKRMNFVVSPQRDNQGHSARPSKEIAGFRAHDRRLVTEARGNGKRLAGKRTEHCRYCEN